MSLSFDDKILGEKTDYYCSSSEDERYDSCEEELEDASKKEEKMQTVQSDDVAGYAGHCMNTGPKGVIEDWRRYKQLENERHEETEKERLALSKKLSLTCRTHLEDEREKSKDQNYLEEIEEIFDELDDEFLQEYRVKRIENMRNAAVNVSKFGSVVELTKLDFLDAIDKEHSSTTVLVHIYKKGLVACNSMNKCIDGLSTQYPAVKFCRVEVSQVQMSLNFSISGVPALLVYKNGELIGNFIRLSDEFGDDFHPNDVASFLIEHGLLPDNSFKPPTVSVSTSNIRQGDDDDDSE